MKPWYALTLALLLSAGGPLRADLVSWTFTAQVLLDDDNGHRVPGLRSGMLLDGTIRFDDAAPGVPTAPPVSGLNYPAANGAIDFTAGGVHLGAGSLPVMATMMRIPASSVFPETLASFTLEADTATLRSYRQVVFGMWKQVDPQAVLDYSIRDLRLDFNHFDSGFLFYNDYTGGDIPLIGAPGQLLIEAQILSITPGGAAPQSPEPSGLALLGLGGAGMGLALWRRRRVAASSLRLTSRGAPASTGR
jgi:hypothetical protein